MTEPAPVFASGVDNERLNAQLRFLLEVDKLKRILRQSLLVDGSRRENSAEHSWHVSLVALVLAGRCDPPVDVGHVVELCLVHDLVEIDAGDTFCYDAGANLDREERERRAADRLFGLLPDDQGRELRALWEEFEAGETPDARFAVALDRLQPLLNNHHSNGGSWVAHGIARSQVLARMRPIESGLPAAWPVVLDLVERNCACGNIREDTA